MDYISLRRVVLNFIVVTGKSYYIETQNIFPLVFELYGC